MKNYMKNGTLKISALLTLAMLTAVPRVVSAQLEPPQNPDDSNLPSQLIDGAFVTIANILLLLIGAVAVIMLIIGGIRYVISGGDSNAVQGAKNTILFAIVGVVVAFLAYAAVNFLVGQLTGSV
jgi:hypothetical protein